MIPEKLEEPGKNKALAFTILVHAGLLPQWSAQQALTLAGEFSAMLSGSEGQDWLQRMYGNQPDRWSEQLAGDERWRVVVNAMTRLRFCDAEGRMDFDSKDGAGSAPAGYLPWFDVPGRRSAQTPVAFGHWSTLGLVQRDKLLALDTGCLWGGCLSAARLEAQPEGPARVAEIKADNGTIAAATRVTAATKCAMRAWSSRPITCSRKPRACSTVSRASISPPSRMCRTPSSALGTASRPTSRPPFCPSLTR